MFTGLSILDDLFSKHQMILVYGEAGSGKTTLLLTIARNISIKGEKALFISTEGSLYEARIVGLEKDYSNIVFANINDFNELLKATLLLPLLDTGKYIFIDSINALYRLEAYHEKSIERLGLILGVLKYMTLHKGLKVFASAQVRAIEESGKEVVASGMPILEYWFDLILKLNRLDGERILRVVKPRSEDKVEVKFIIEKHGVDWIEY